MGTNTWTFEELPNVEAIDLELEYTYEEDGGDYYNPPSISTEVCIADKDWKDLVMAKYIEAAKLAIEKIEDELATIEDDCDLLRDWAIEDAYADECDKADAAYEEMKMRGDN